jgi:S-adenosylmethionine hydrolase
MTVTITLLTDFGIADSYVAEVKGVLLSRAPGVTLVDVSHEVPPGSIRAAQFLLARTWHRFPAGTVHLVVVDPRVGSDRRALAAGVEGHWFIAPDNGLLSVLPDGGRYVSLPVLRDAAPTFHGRDVFAPAAARLASGARLEELGSPVPDPVRIPLPTPRTEGHAIVGEILYVDRFGNLVTNIPREGLRPESVVRVVNQDVGPLRRTFTDVEPDALLAYIGSGGTVEIAVHGGSAAKRLGVDVGVAVRI